MARGKVRSSQKATSKSACVPPPIVPRKHCSVINPHQINAIARLIDLARPDTFMRYPALVPRGTSRGIIPLNFVGYDNWDQALYAIRFFNQFSTTKQEIEIANAKLLTRTQQNKLREKCAQLMKNRPLPLMNIRLPATGATARQSKNHLISLVELSASRSLSPVGIGIAADISGNKQCERKCEKCGFLPTQKILKGGHYCQLSLKVSAVCSASKLKQRICVSFENAIPTIEINLILLNFSLQHKRSIA